MQSVAKKYRVYPPMLNATDVKRVENTKNFLWSFHKNIEEQVGQS